MTDKVNTEVRSAIMRAVKGKNTGPEVLFRKIIYKNGFRYRLHNKRLPGSPDLAISKFKLAIFINGCFWHLHEGCKHLRIPRSNTNYWESKLIKNKERDQRNYNALVTMGWKFMVVWECELREPENIILEKFRAAITELGGFNQYCNLQHKHKKVQY